MHGKDFTGGEGVLFFKSGETTKDIVIPIIDDMSATGTEEYFEVDIEQDLTMVYELIINPCP